MSPVVVNRHHYRTNERLSLPELPLPWRYIGRGTPLGNPWTKQQLEAWVHEDDDRVEAMGLDPEFILRPYRGWLWEKLKARDTAVIREFSLIRDTTALVCSCKRPDGSGVCHGDVVVDAWEWWKRVGCPGLEIAIVGSKSWPDVNDIAWLVCNMPGGVNLLTRGVAGVDQLVATVVGQLEGFNLTTEIVPADRAAHGRGAEFKRDRALVERAHWVLAYSMARSTGTENIIKIAQEMKRPLHVCRWTDQGYTWDEPYNGGFL